MIQRLISTTLIVGFALTSFAATPRETNLELFAEIKKNMKEAEQAIEKNEAQAAHFTLALQKLKKVLDPSVTEQDKKIMEDKKNAFLENAEKNKIELMQLKHKAQAQLLLERNRQKDQTSKMARLLKEIKEISEKLLSSKDQKEIKTLTIRKTALEHQAQIIADEMIKTIDLTTRYTRLIKEKNQEDTASCEAQL